MEEIRERVGFIGVDWVDQDEDEAEGKDEKEVKEVKEVRLLDYACGTGVGKLFFSALCLMDSVVVLQLEYGGQDC